MILKFFSYFVLGALLVWPLVRLWRLLLSIASNHVRLHYLLPYAPAAPRNTAATPSTDDKSS